MLILGIKSQKIGTSASKIQCFVQTNFGPKWWHAVEDNYVGSDGQQ